MQTCSQVLLTQENLSSRGQHNNATNTFRELLFYGVIPVVNENDTVAVEQLRIGDNDTLSAQVANLVGAEWLFLLTDVDALYTSNPSVDPNATPIRNVPNLWNLEVDTSTTGTQWGTGGMATKLTAARIATAGGCNMAICHYAEPHNVLGILSGKKIGTVFHAAVAPIRDGKRWLLSTPVRGEVWVDSGAVRAVTVRRCSLFSAGIVKTVGDYGPQETVRICDENGREFARGLSNYSREDVERVKGMSSKQFFRVYGSSYGQEEIIHRASICLLMSVGADESEKCAADSDTNDDDDGQMSPPDGMSRSNTPVVPSGDASKTSTCTGTAGTAAATVATEAEVTARLAQLMKRLDEEDADEKNDWRGELEEAVNEERAAEGKPVVAVLGDEDINEAGWLPK